MLLVCLAACASREPPPYVPDTSAIDRAIAEPAPARPAAGLLAPVATEGPRRIAEPTPPPALRSSRRVTLRLSHAPLGEVVRLLASEAGVGVVLASSLEQPVSLDVRRADPLAVLDALASAHALDVERTRGLLVVRRRGP